MKKNYVTFYSPGTFVSETTTKDIDNWNVAQAEAMACEIEERYGAKPYGFKFETRSRSATDLDSKVTNTSPMYYLGGEVLTLEDVKAKNDPKDRILISNMEHNGYDKIIVNNNSWKFTGPLDKDDIILNSKQCYRRKFGY